MLKNVKTLTKSKKRHSLHLWL